MASIKRKASGELMNHGPVNVLMHVMHEIASRKARFAECLRRMEGDATVEDATFARDAVDEFLLPDRPDFMAEVPHKLVNHGDEEDFLITIGQKCRDECESALQLCRAVSDKVCEWKTRGCADTHPAPMET